MCEEKSESSPEALPEGPSPASGLPANDDLEAEVVETDAGAREMTLFPRDASGFDLMSTWITAREGSFVELTTMR